MRIQDSRIACLVPLVWVAAIAGLTAQQPLPTSTVLTAVPRVMWLSGVFRPATLRPVAPVESLTVTIYRDRAGGDALWHETQTVAMEAGGRYNLLMGSTVPDGLPVELFTGGEPRWIGITFNRPGEVEQPRVPLASVPYALKAGDADTLGGLPVSAFLQAPGRASSSTAGPSPQTSRSDAPEGVSAATAGTAGYLGMFVDSTNLGNSTLFQVGGAIALGTTTPRDMFHVSFTNGNGGLTGYGVQNLSAAANAYSGMLFYDQNGTLGLFQGFNNATHEYRINNVGAGGSISFRIAGTSRLLVANNGNIGLSVPAPNSKLDVAGDINLTGTLKFAGDSVLRLSTSLSNVGLGVGNLGSNTSGISNTALGYAALVSNTEGAFNTATGYGVLNLNTEGSNNTGVGAYALHNTSGNATGGSNNTAVGYGALQSNTTGRNNLAIGVSALLNSSNGIHNTAVGTNALNATNGVDPNGSYNTVVGDGALRNNGTGSNNIAIGYNAGTDISSVNSNNIVVGTAGSSGDSGTIRMGNNGTQTSFFAAGVRGVTTGLDDAVAVVISSTGQLGTVSSSRRFKEDVHDMGDASRGLMRLRPVTFRYTKPFGDGSKPIQYGLIAEEVADVYPDLVARSADGQIETVKYQVLDAMVLNEVQRQHAHIQRLETEIRAVVEQHRAVLEQNTDLQRRLAALEAAVAGRR